MAVGIEVVTVVEAAQPSLFSYLFPVKLVRNLLKHRHLIWQLAWRDVSARYSGTQLGLFWSFLNPLLLLVVYTYVFCIVLHAKWGKDPNQSYFTFALTLFAGLTAFNVFNEVIGRAPTIIVSCPNYVKRVVFPLEILVVVLLVASLVTFFASLAILLIGQIFLQGLPEATILFFPLGMIPLILLGLGFGWLLASLGVFLRDIGQSVVLILQVLTFMTPIFYPIDSPILNYSPLAISVENFRRTVLWGQMPDWTMLAIATAAGLICCQLGYAFFMRTKKGFADVI